DSIRSRQAASQLGSLPGSMNTCVTIVINCAPPLHVLSPFCTPGHDGDDRTCGWVRCANRSLPMSARRYRLAWAGSQGAIWLLLAMLLGACAPSSGSRDAKGSAGTAN